MSAWNRGRPGIIGLAFGQHDDKAGPSNVRIAKNLSILEMYEGDAFVTGQWEVELAFAELDEPSPIDVAISTYEEKYITTKEAIERSLEVFKSEGITRVVLVGHPLHLRIIHTMIGLGIWKFEGFEFDRYHDDLMDNVPYDQSEGNTQWWTTGPVKFFAYLVKSALTRQHGK